MVSHHLVKNCVKKYLKQGILLSEFYYKVGKDKGSIFFQSLYEVAILHFAFLGRKKWLPHFLLWKYKEKRDTASHETK